MNSNKTNDKDNEVLMAMQNQIVALQNELALANQAAVNHSA